jgi:hypothetical protein
MTQRPHIPAGLVRLIPDLSTPGLYDVELNRPENLGNYSSIDCHLVVYPYSRKVNAHHIRVLPFEEYVTDIISRQRSVYIKVEERSKYVFGALLALALVAVFAEFRPVELVSLESIVSVFGAYFVGKELWDDIERALQHLSRRWKLRYVESYYPYQLAGRTTLSQYAGLAKQVRYGRRSLLPERIDFIQQSNSQTVRLRFGDESLSAFPGRSAHIASLHVEPEAARDFERAGFLFGVKLSLNRRRWGLERSLVLFQSLDRSRPGCLDQQGQWRDGCLFYRRTVRLGNVKLFRDYGTAAGQQIVQLEPRTKKRRKDAGT